jgi:hypothetical protein
MLFSVRRPMLAVQREQIQCCVTDHGALLACSDSLYAHGWLVNDNLYRHGFRKELSLLGHFTNL